ncbi:MAG TPA: GlsB/YeaQ/YmgE family stress response membrane protein [Xanthobacteraceae bacterium]|nr:GlsB/YeaQ/YmgE family stress response membrane protein [Xanthobacteraceae bacterium]
MSVIAWIILGLIAGFIANRIVGRRGGGMIFDTVLGIIGAVVGGWLFAFFGAHEVMGFDPYSFIVAIVGAVLVLLIYHALTDARPATRF